MPYIKIDSCSECRHRRTEPDYTADSWERPEKWICSKKKSRAKDPWKACGGLRVIKRYYEHPKDDPGVPEWCPLRLKEEK